MPNILDVPHRELRALFDTGAPVFLSVNPVEYHGPHLSLHNDTLVSAGLIRDLYAGLLPNHPGWPLLTTSDLEVGVEPCPGLGSRVSRFSTVRDLVLDTCRTLVDFGVKRVVFMTFHGAPLHSLAIQASIDYLATKQIRSIAPLNIILNEMLETDGTQYAPAYAHIEDIAERQDMMQHLATDFHAGFFETSIALHYAPQSVDPHYRELAPCPPIKPIAAWQHLAKAASFAGNRRLALEFNLAANGLGWQALNPFPGYTGRPHRATAEAGAFFAKTLTERFVDATEAVFAGAVPPQPIMAWSAKLTLGGRMTPVKSY